MFALGGMLGLCNSKLNNTEQRDSRPAQVLCYNFCCELKIEIDLMHTDLSQVNINANTCDS